MVIGNWRPFKGKADNWMSLLDEIIILGVLYHMMCLSEWVPFHHWDAVGYSLMIYELLVLAVFIMLIVYNIIKPLIQKVKMFYYKKRFEKARRIFMEHCDENIQDLIKKIELEEWAYNELCYCPIKYKDPGIFKNEKKAKRMILKMH